MARFNHGIFSKAKNKLGGVTFQQYEGMQIGKEYQPNVKNPNTANQISARAKFKLASQMVALYESILLIVGARLSSYSRYIRGAFVGAISRAATFQTDKATMQIDAFAQTVNAKAGYSDIPAPTISGVSAQNATINATVGDVVTYEVVAYDNDANILGRRTENFTATAAAQTIILPATTATPTSYDIVAVAARAMSENGAVIYDNLDSRYSISIARLIAAGDVAASNVVAVTLSQA